jgi:hypothetical protein
MAEQKPSLPPTQDASRGHHRPLIDLITNEWREQEKAEAARSRRADDDDGNLDPLSYSSLWFLVKRVMKVYLVFLLALATYFFVIRPAMMERDGLAQSVAGDLKKGVFGNNFMPSFLDIAQVKELDPSLLPSKSNKKRRLIFIGDVHGCLDECMCKLPVELQGHVANDVQQ